jgi:hypothetical protein
MQTLLHRLKPKVLKPLLESGQRYDTAAKTLVELDENLFYEDLTIRQVKNLITFSDIVNSKMSPWDFKYGDCFFEDQFED